MTEVTIHTLMEDSIFREWTLRKPSPLPPSPLGKRKRLWRVFVQLEEGGKWNSTGKMSWKRAMRVFVRYALSNASGVFTCHDAALNCSTDAFKPPVVKVGGTRRHFSPLLPEGWSWCGYCRRVTRFGYFSKHHTFGRTSPIRNEKRCVICGARDKSQPKVKDLVTRKDMHG